MTDSILNHPTIDHGVRAWFHHLQHGRIVAPRSIILALCFEKHATIIPDNNWRQISPRWWHITLPSEMALADLVGLTQIPGLVSISGLSIGIGGQVPDTSLYKLNH